MEIQSQQNRNSKPVLIWCWYSWGTLNINISIKIRSFNAIKSPKSESRRAWCRKQPLFVQKNEYCRVTGPETTTVNLLGFDQWEPDLFSPDYLTQWLFSSWSPGPLLYLAFREYGISTFRAGSRYSANNTKGIKIYRSFLPISKPCVNWGRLPLRAHKSVSTAFCLRQGCRLGCFRELQLYGTSNQGVLNLTLQAVKRCDSLDLLFWYSTRLQKNCKGFPLFQQCNLRDFGL